MPLQQLAERNSAAVLMISHFNKGTIDGTAMSRISGSGALVAVCRSSWLVERDPSALDGPKRIFAPIKNNIGDDQTGFAFEIDQIETEGGIKSSRVRFLPGTVTISADELVKGASASASTIGASTRDQAKQFLEQALADGPVLQSRIREQANAEGHAWRTIERAKKELKVVSRNRTDLGGWQWSLKPDGQPEMNFGLSEPDDRQVRQQSQFNLLEEVGGEVVEPEDRHKGGSAGSGGLATLADRVSTATTPLQSRIVGTDDGIQT